MASKIFANTSALSKGANLLNQEKLARLTDCADGFEGLKVLAEFSYGDTTIDNPYDFEILIESEMSKLYDFLKSTSPSDYATACFLAEFEFHNLKCAFKTKYGKIKEYDNLVYSFAKIEPETLLEAVLTDEYRSFSESMKIASLEIDGMHIAGTLTPAKIDYICDKYMYAEIMENLKHVSSKTLKDYFIAKLDMTNIQTMLRAKKYEVDASSLPEILFDGGNIAVSSLANQYEASFDAIVEFYLYTPYNGIIKTLARELSEGGNQSEFEQERDAYLVKLFKDGKYLSVDADLFYGYFVAKTFEFDNIRLIMVGLNNKLDKNKIKARLKELYV